jgi:hypothetical protein
MSDTGDFRKTARELVEAGRFLRRVRKDFANRDDPELACTCSLCWMENFSAVRALHAVARAGMSEREIDLAVWDWMHGPQGPCERKRQEARP